MKEYKIDHSILRVLALIIGGLSILLGYFLFIKGVTGQASLSVHASSNGGQLLNAAPGLFFAISGVAMVIVSLLKRETLIVVDRKVRKGAGKATKANDASPTEEANVPEQWVLIPPSEYKEILRAKRMLEDLDVPTFIRRTTD
jgi:hypothetical protein